MKIITRKEALKRGLTRYFTGKPCKHGHMVERYTKSSNCVVCRSQTRKAQYDKDPERERQRVREWHRNKLYEQHLVSVDEEGMANMCACCHGYFEKLHLDHCHQTGFFRGWICGNCNRGIGLLGDTSAAVFEAFMYLKLFENAALDPDDAPWPTLKNQGVDRDAISYGRDEHDESL